MFLNFVVDKRCVVLYCILYIVLYCVKFLLLMNVNKFVLKGDLFLAIGSSIVGDWHLREPQSAQRAADFGRVRRRYLLALSLFFSENAHVCLVFFFSFCSRSHGARGVGRRFARISHSSAHQRV